MGGALLQKVDRDTLKFAFKCSAIMIDGKWRDVFKSPVTDMGKRSKGGRLDLIKHYDAQAGWAFETIRLDDVERDTEARSTAMRTVFENGELYPHADESLEQIRERASREFARAAVAA